MSAGFDMLHANRKWMTKKVADRGERCDGDQDAHRQLPLQRRVEKHGQKSDFQQDGRDDGEKVPSAVTHALLDGQPASQQCSDAGTDEQDGEDDSERVDGMPKVEDELLDERDFYEDEPKADCDKVGHHRQPPRRPEQFTSSTHCPERPKKENTYHKY